MFHIILKVVQNILSSSVTVWGFFYFTELFEAFMTVPILKFHTQSSSMLCIVEKYH